MSYDPETPFDSIEGSHEYVSLLAEAIEEARKEAQRRVKPRVAASRLRGKSSRDRSMQMRYSDLRHENLLDG